MSADDLLDKIDAWAFEERGEGFTSAVSPDYREGFRDACDAVRGMIQAEREPAPWLGGHCKYRNLKHEDCPGVSLGRPCICPCHKSDDSSTCVTCGVTVTDQTPSTYYQRHDEVCDGDLREPESVDLETGDTK